MDWNAKIFAYCERGLDPSFWAEPLNALSNAAFLIAAGLAFRQWWPVRGQRGSWVEFGLASLVFVIGIGSFLFHTFATGWAIVADTAPIGIFMLAYLGYALRVFAGLGWLWTLPLLGAFILSLQSAEGMRCGGRACLNGSFGYLPALLALVAIGAWLGRQRHPAARAILAGAGVFAVSLAFRTLDRSICPATALFSRNPLGTHFIWHMLNATLLCLLLSAAIRHRATTSS
jgi:hypothetical protein